MAANMSGSPIASCNADLTSAPLPTCSPPLTSYDTTTLIDDATVTIEHDNPYLKSKLPGDDSRGGTAPENLSPVIDLITNIGSNGDSDRTHDTLAGVDDDSMQCERCGGRI